MFKLQKTYSNKLQLSMMPLLRANNVQPLPEQKPLQGYKFIDLFAGIGGIRLPFDKLGAKCVFSSEWDKYSQVTYARNFGEKPHGDITKIEASNIPSFDMVVYYG